MSAKWIFALIPLLAAAAAVADEPLRVGVLAGGAYTQITDPDGPTQTRFSPDLGVIAIADWARDARLFYQIRYQHFTLDADTQHIGQDVKRVGVSASYQHLLRLTRIWKPWLGVGLGYAHESDTLRHTVDSGGFLAQTYPDRTDSTFLAVLSASSEWRWTHNWQLGFTLQYDAPLSANGTSAIALDAEAVYTLR